VPWWSLEKYQFKLHIKSTDQEEKKKKQQQQH